MQQCSTTSLNNGAVLELRISGDFVKIVRMLTDREMRGLELKVGQVKRMNYPAIVVYTYDANVPPNWKEQLA